MENEAHIFKRMQNGDWTAFNLFFKEYMEQLYLYAVAFVKERAVAEDIVQDVFIYLWTHREKIHYTGPIYGYLLLAVKNACINHKAHLEVEEKYRKGISVDENEKAWKNLISKGEHGKVNELICHDPRTKTGWDITGIPRFLLIDKNFNIISADAPRPSDKDVITPLLEKYNQGK